MRRQYRRVDGRQLETEWLPHVKGECVYGIIKSDSKTDSKGSG